ncbi:proteasome assembly chaperone 3-like [Daphnia pulicaria]|uniref:proteasome assembly chaperone 3-like n=1 Tax=Daphnia pulicaria TaxID=35523 RepID=UPI001EEBF386|nr:proteasome assembly chaperone 3-like [Daphnia pulicaria]
MEGVAGRFPVQTRTETIEINGNSTEVVISKFSDKLFIILTQYGKVGNVVEVRRDVAQKDDSSSAVYSVRVLFGRDDEEIHVAARFLVNFIPTQQNILFALSLKDYQPKTLRQVGEFLKINLSLTEKSA